VLHTVPYVEWASFELLLPLFGLRFRFRFRQKRNLAKSKLQLLVQRLSSG